MKTNFIISALVATALAAPHVAHRRNVGSGGDIFAGTKMNDETKKAVEMELTAAKQAYDILKAAADHSAALKLEGKREWYLLADDPTGAESVEKREWYLLADDPTGAESVEKRDV